MHRNAKRTLAAVLSLALAAGTIAVSAPIGADAAAKPKLSKTKLTLEAGKKAKVTVKNVAAKKVKKLNVKSAKKAVAAVKKNGKTAFTVTGKKEGKTTVTASVTVGKKTTKLKLSVTVKAAAGKENQTAAPSAAPSATTAAQATATATATAPAAQNTGAPSGQETETPSGPQEPEQTPLVNYSEGFDNGLGEWYGRGLDGIKLEVATDPADIYEGTGAAVISGREDEDGGHAWTGPAIDLSKSLTPGGKYRVSFYAKVAEADKENWNKGKNKGIRLMVSSAQYFSKEDKDEGGDNLHCENYPRDTYYQIGVDEWTKIETEFIVPEYFYEFLLYVETTDLYGTAMFVIDSFELERISAPAPYDSTLPSIYQSYADYIPTMGVAVSYDQLMNENTLGFVKHQFNGITMGNEMKLDNLMGTGKTLTAEEAEAAGYVLSDAYKNCPDNKDADGNLIVPEIRFGKVDQILQIAKDNGIKVRLHSPFWHSQMPQHFFTKNYDNPSDKPQDPNSFPERYTDKDTMYTRIEMYVRTLLSHIYDKGYGEAVAAYDVVNEYLHSNEAFSSAEGKYRNYWACIFGAEDLESPYVKTAFAVANDELTKRGVRDQVALMYNDFDTYNEVEEVITLINNINKKDDLNPDGAKLCDGIGMQSHMSVSGPGVDKYEAAIQAFDAAGFQIQITELDIASGNVTGETSEDNKQNVWEKNAKAYGDYMGAILRQKEAGANITSVTIWGITDASSWIKDTAPVLFGEGVADKKPAFDAVINAAVNFKK